MILSWISLNCRRWSGRAKKCAQSDQCGQCDGRYLQAAASMCALCGEMKDKCRTLVVVAYITTTAHDRIHGKQRYRVSQLLTVPLLLTTQYTVLPPTARVRHLSMSINSRRHFRSHQSMPIE